MDLLCRAATMDPAGTLAPTEDAPEQRNTNATEAAIVRPPFVWVAHKCTGSLPASVIVVQAEPAFSPWELDVGNTTPLQSPSSPMSPASPASPGAPAGLKEAERPPQRPQWPQRPQRPHRPQRPQRPQQRPAPTIDKDAILNAEFSAPPQAGRRPQYPSHHRRIQLARMTGLTQRQVQIWFQDKRQRVQQLLQRVKAEVEARATVAPLRIARI